MSRVYYFVVCLSMFGCAVATQQTQQVKSTKTQELPKPALKTETKAVQPSLHLW